MTGSQEDYDPLELECAVLTPTNLRACQEFSCGDDEWDADLNDFLKNDALPQGEQRLNVTYLFLAQGKPVAYVALSAGQVKAPEASAYVWAPALLIGKLAVDETHQRQGIGAQVLGFIRDLALALPIGCRFLVIHVDMLNSEAQRFYEREGFVCPPDMPKDKQVMAYDLVNEIVEKGKGAISGLS
jgi:GNAT superfamily N-acetyltransferase